jgi:hypothetical protein
MARRGATVENPEVEALLASLRDSIASGERHWFVAVLDGVGRWPLAEEEVEGRAYRYLVGGEAFDWLLLAERLCASLADVIPEEELAPLLSHGQFPTEVTEEEFQRLLGGPKHRAHLNFFYGVQVEEALQLGVGQEVEKEQRCRVWENGHIDDEVCNRIYGASRWELLQRFREKSGIENGTFSLADLHEFTYWLFKHRVNYADPARVASDTRKGLAALARVRASASRLREPVL